MFSFIFAIVQIIFWILLVAWIVGKIRHKPNFATGRYLLISLTLLFVVGLFSPDSNSSSGESDKAPTSESKSSAKTSSTSKKESSSKKTEVVAKKKPSSDNDKAILTKLVSYTDKESAGPNSNYYWTSGKARMAQFKSNKAGYYHFTSDSQGRPTTARAVLTYNEYQSSRGSRQGDPLGPIGWPADNPKVAISYSLTGRTYHGYLYNRSHSIGDSLLGKKSYTSADNFTTGTRPQNVGANQGGGMRHAEETAEQYWESNPNSKTTIKYETTPLYKGSEEIPRGSIVDIKSSDLTTLSILK
nr:DNA/RNA non-specific endonuclease [Secundilactobacillus malefermentans]